MNRQAYYTEYRKEYKSRSLVKGRERRERQRLQAIHWLGGRCKDCDNPDIRVLVFDHVRGEKTCNVARLLEGSWKRIEEELAKCDLVCANCHLIRTNERIPKVTDTFVGRRQRTPPRKMCKYGHPFIPENRLKNNGCRVCANEATRRYRAKQKGQYDSG